MANDLARLVFEAPFRTQALTRGTFIRESPGWYQVVSPGTPSASANEVIHSAISVTNVESKIEETIREYAEIGSLFKWCVSPFSSPKDMGARLEKRGFGSWGACGMFGCSVDLRIEAPPEISIEPVSRDNLDDYVLANLSGWILDRAPTAEEFARLHEDMLWLLEKRSMTARFILARVNGEPAATAGFHLKSNLAYFVGGNVLKRFRGHGLYRALLSHRLQSCRALNVPIIATIARERTSAPILRKLGFQVAYQARIHQLGGALPE